MQVTGGFIDIHRLHIHVFSTTLWSAIVGTFLWVAEASRIQDYLRALTTQIPVVEQCEALYQPLRFKLKFGRGSTFLAAPNSTT